MTASPAHTRRQVLMSLASLLSLLCLTALPVRSQTPVLFPLNQMFGGAPYTKTFTIQAAQSFITNGTNAWVGSCQTVTPTGGTNPIVYLTPNTYLVTFPDATYPWRIYVPSTTNPQNALNLSTGPLPTFLVTLPNPNMVTNGETGVTLDAGGYNPAVTFSYDGGLALDQSMQWGWGAVATNMGVAIGGLACAPIGGTAVGWGATAPDFGAALGNNAAAAIGGVAVGAGASGTNTSVAVGWNALAGGTNDVALGARANAWGAGFTDTAEIGAGTAILPGALHYRGVPIVDGNGNHIGSGSGLTNVPGAAITGGLNLIMTNTAAGMTNRLYFTNGILVRFTSP